MFEIIDTEKEYIKAGVVIGTISKLFALKSELTEEKLENILIENNLQDMNLGYYNKENCFLFVKLIANDNIEERELSHEDINALRIIKMRLKNKEVFFFTEQGEQLGILDENIKNNLVREVLANLEKYDLTYQHLSEEEKSHIETIEYNIKSGEVFYMTDMAEKVHGNIKVKTNDIVQNFIHNLEDSNNKKTKVDVKNIKSENIKHKITMVERQDETIKEKLEHAKVSYSNKK